jgi:hypothetical protein
LPDRLWAMGTFANNRNTARNLMPFMIGLHFRSDWFSS